MTGDKAKRILITGASGFIGKHLVAEALSRGYEVCAGIRASSSKDGLKGERITFMDLIYGNPEEMARQLDFYMDNFGAFDYVIHNAGLTKALDKQDFYRVNALYTDNLLKAFALSGNKPGKFLLMSSLSTFGAGDEKNFTPVNLTDSQDPQTEYGKSKLLAENYVRSQNALPYLILRPTGVYGPGDKDYLMEVKSIRRGFHFSIGSTPQRITFIYVKDLAAAAFMALENKNLLNREYFVADGDVHTGDEFAAILKKLLDKRFLLHMRVPGWMAYIACLCIEGLGKLARKPVTLNTDKYKILKQRNWICDTAPLRDETGFTSSRNLQKGLEESIAWYKEKGWL